MLRASFLRNGTRSDDSFVLLFDPIKKIVHQHDIQAFGPPLSRYGIIIDLLSLALERSKKFCTKAFQIGARFFLCLALGLGLFYSRQFKLFARVRHTSKHFGKALRMDPLEPRRFFNSGVPNLKSLSENLGRCTVARNRIP
jgi:hypothetical protein